MTTEETAMAGTIRRHDLRVQRLLSAGRGRLRTADTLALSHVVPGVEPADWVVNVGGRWQRLGDLSFEELDELYT